MRAAIFCLALGSLALAQVPPAPRRVIPGQGRSGTPAPVATPAPAKPVEKPVPPKPSVPLPRDLKYPPLRAVQIPKVETVTLPNGLKVYLLEDHELPVINGTALVRTGNLFDPADKAGLATVTGTVMRSGGTKEKTGDQLDEQLENIAARVESGIGETSGSVSFSAMKENADEVMTVFRDVLTQPEFREDKIDLSKTQLRSSISRRNDDPHGVVQREFVDTVYGKDTPYGWRIEYATVNRISRDDVRAFYQRYYFPANVMLAVSGDFSAAEMRTRLERLFAGWTVKQEPVPAFPAVKGSPAPGTFLAVKRDVTQTFFAMGHLGGDRRDKDYPALEVMSDILGGGFQSRLFLRVRTRMGAAYQISASWGASYDHPGLFQVSGSTKSVSTSETLKAVQEEVERIRTAEVTDAELETAKQSSLNSLVFAFDTKTKTLSRMITYEYYGYPMDFIDRYQKALAAVTKADVLRVAKERLKPADFTIMTVGKPEDFGARLESLGRPVNLVDTTIPQPVAEPTKVDDASLAAGVELLRLVQDAVGGAAKLAAVKDLAMQIDFRLDQGAGGMRVKQTDRWIAPSHFRQDSVLPMGKISAYSDGATGWIVTPQGTGPLAGAQLKQVQGDLFRLYFRLLTGDRQGYQVNRAAANAIEFTSKVGDVARLTVDPATGLPTSVTYEAVHVTGPAIPVVETYGDFRSVNGIKVPFKATITQGGNKFADVTVEDYKLNTGLKLEELSARPK